MRNGASWSAAESGVLFSVGHHDGTRASSCCRVMPWRWPRNEARPPLGAGPRAELSTTPVLKHGPSNPKQVTTEAADDFKGFCEKGKLDLALDVLLSMDQEGTVPAVNMYTRLLKACIKRQGLTQAKRLSAHLAKRNLCSGFLGEYMVSTLVKCGGLEDAMEVFHKLPERTVFSWTAVISGHTASGKGRQALHLYEQMQEEKVTPNSYTFVTLLKACGSLIDLDAGRRIHADILKHGCEVNQIVGNCLIDMYGRCGSVVDAKNVFDKLSNRDVVSWTAMLVACSQKGQSQMALNLYEEMLEAGVEPDARTFVSALQACGILAEEDVAGDGPLTEMQCLKMGKAIHFEAERRGCTTDVFVGNTLVSMYGKCGSVEDAQNVFDGLHQRDVVSWNAILAAYLEQGQAERALQVYEQMREESVNPTEWTFAIALQACSMLAEKEMHQEHAVDGHSLKVKSLRLGKVIHCDAQRKNYASDIIVGSTLITMYGKCGSVTDAQIVLDALSRPDVVAWTGMMAAYIEVGQADKTLWLYERMLKEGVRPNTWTFVSVSQACGILAEAEEAVSVNSLFFKVKALEKGRTLHAEAHRAGYASDTFVGNTLVSMYGKCRSILDAENTFKSLSQRDVVSWNAIFVAHVEQEQAEKVFELYEEMLNDGVSPNHWTIVTCLQACGMIAEKEEEVMLDGQARKAKSLQTGKALHAEAERIGFDSDVIVGNTLIGSKLSPFLASALVSAYGRCASMSDAQSVFDTLPEPDIVSWTALIAGYARQGDSTSSLQCFEKMLQAGVRPNGVTFLAVLAACSHAGLVDKGSDYFEAMTRDYHIEPEIDHYVAMVDLLGRAGCFARIEALLSSMPMQPNLSLWLCLLAACRKHGELVIAQRTFERAVQLQPDHPAAYILMANIYADAGLASRVKKVKKLRRKRVASKASVRSGVEPGKEA